MSSEQFFKLVICVVLGLAVANFAVQVQEKREKIKTIHRVIDTAEVFVRDK